MELSRHVISVKGQDLQQVLTAISSLRNLMVVSIAGSAVTPPAAFSRDLLQALLEGAPEHLHLEALPPDQHRVWAANHIAQRVASVGALRSLMRNHRVAELLVEVRAFIADSGELLSLLTSYVQQVASPAVAGQVEDLRHALGQLSDSCFKHEDNVRCMDDLQYETLPPLKKLQRLFEK